MELVNKFKAQKKLDLQIKWKDIVKSFKLEVKDGPDFIFAVSNKALYKIFVAQFRNVYMTNTIFTSVTSFDSKN